MHVVSCLNLKGGAGKSTTAVNLAGALSELGESVAPGISQRVAIAESVIERKWIGDYAPSSPGHDDFMALARFVMRATARLRKQTEAP
jgi:cellulose biosynthesis protein BcsQ